VPLTLAVNCLVSPGASVEVAGLIITLVTPFTTATVTLAVPDFVVSKVLVALIVYVAVVAGAVY
jgi:hypothetical protein